MQRPAFSQSPKRVGSGPSRPPISRGRAGVVIDTMVRNGFLSASAAASADPAQIKLQPPAKQNSARYFTDWALPQLDTLIDETNDPIDVYTTLDIGMQAAADPTPGLLGDGLTCRLVLFGDDLDVALAVYGDVTAGGACTALDRYVGAAGDVEVAAHGDLAADDLLVGLRRVLE